VVFCEISKLPEVYDYLCDQGRVFGFYQESDILDQKISKESVVLETEENAVFGDGHQVSGFEIGKLALHAVAQQIPVNPNQTLAFLLRKWLFRQVLIFQILKT
jgi:hypothetical protein